jgi:hypothetical protein
MSQNAKLIHGRLQVVVEELLRVAQDLNGLSLDTIFALGETMGIVAKAKALVARDIDQAEEAHAQARTVSGHHGDGKPDDG